jgi:hypothetical protein
MDSLHLLQETSLAIQILAVHLFLSKLISLTAFLFLPFIAQVAE